MAIDQNEEWDPNLFAYSIIKGGINGAIDFGMGMLGGFSGEMTPFTSKIIKKPLDLNGFSIILKIVVSLLE